MSWSVSVSGKAPDELFESLDEAFDNYNPEPAIGVKEQFEAAKSVVNSLLGEGVVDGEKFNCSLNGHVGTQPAEGHRNDSVGVSLSTSN